MTDPSHARDIKGRGRYYAACSPECPLGEGLLISVTNAQGVINKPALVPAAVKATADVAWQELPTMLALSRQGPNGPNGCEKKRVAERCGGCRFCLTAAIKREHQNQWDRAADFGSLVHTHAYARNVGRPMPADPEVEPFIGQYNRFLADWGVDLATDVEAAETTIFDLKVGYAGTGDIWLWLPTGKNSKRELWLVDIKTSLKKPVTAVYPDQVLQLAGLRFAPKALLPDDSVVDVPKFAGTALLNLRADDYRLISVPADRTAHRAFVHAVGLQTFLHLQDTKTWSALSAPAAQKAVA